MAEAENAALFEDEALTFEVRAPDLTASVTDAFINEKYVRGEIRIVTEQARYPLNTIAQIVESDSYVLSPEYQRRHRWLPERQSRLIESLIPRSRGYVEPHDFCSRGKTSYAMRRHSAMLLPGGSYNGRCIMAVSVQQSHPIAH